MPVIIARKKPNTEKYRTVSLFLLIAVIYNIRSYKFEAKRKNDRSKIEYNLSAFFHYLFSKYLLGKLKHTKKLLSKKGEKVKTQQTNLLLSICSKLILPTKLRH